MPPLSTRPELLAQWDYSKNIDSDPNIRSLFSRKRAWWICPKGHSWQTKILSRIKGEGISQCPFCSGRLASEDNNLEVDFPELAEEWDYDKNQKSPKDITQGSKTKVWWRCSKGHEWKARIGNRVNGNGCPFCGKKFPSEEYNLFTERPDVVKQWDWDKNKLTPEQVTHGSGEIVWWICPKGHSWQCSIKRKTRNAQCSICTSKNEIIK